MKIPCANCLHRWALALCLLLPLQRAEAQFVELTAEVVTTAWDFWVFFQKLEQDPDKLDRQSVYTRSNSIHCVIGTNAWMIEGDFSSNARETWWFTGTNVIERTVRTKPVRELGSDNRPAPARSSAGGPLVGRESLRVYKCADGNPGRPARVRDLLGFDPVARISWLAFCSGPALKRPGRKIFPPDTLWKESRLAPSAWPDRTAVFEDDLGLPSHVGLRGTDGQPVFQYQVPSATNMLDWNFPLEFDALQYKQTGTNHWELLMTAKGRLTSIHPTSRLEIPPHPLPPQED